MSATDKASRGAVSFSTVAATVLSIAATGRSDAATVFPAIGTGGGSETGKKPGFFALTSLALHYLCSAMIGGGSEVGKKLGVFALTSLALHYLCSMEILTTTQIRELDAFTIKNEPIAPIDLMERAAAAFTAAFTARWEKGRPVKVFAGPGNNGGDALAIARILTCRGYDVDTYLFNTEGRLSEGCSTNRQRLLDTPDARFHEITSTFDPPKVGHNDIIIDGLFGTGLNKPLQKGFAALVKFINASPAEVVAIDVPSGLMCEDNSYNVKDHIVRATATFTFQLPKLAFLLADCSDYVGRWELLDIGLSAEGIGHIQPDMTLTEPDDIRPLLLPRNAFGHKGTFGHALLIAGSYGMAGAATLAARACLRSGVGKTTLHTPTANNDILQISVPEAVLSHDSDLQAFSTPVDTQPYDAVGIGPGIGQTRTTERALLNQLNTSQVPIVIDADALTLLGRHREQIGRLPAETILTPHPKELAALADNCIDAYTTLSTARDLARRQHLLVVLKGHFTAICTPSGHTYFNPTGNAGMATAGSGDVLTGILTALLARGYRPEAACRVGVYVHGLAGDLAAGRLGEESLTASDIIHELPAAFRLLYSETKP